MTKFVYRSLAFAALTLMPMSAFAQQVTVVDGTVNHTMATGAYITRALPGGFPADLTAPVDYAGGVAAPPGASFGDAGSKLTSYQMCLVQGANKACSNYADLQFDATGTFAGHAGAEHVRPDLARWTWPLP
ncbi:MAG: hypothetical protein R3E66_06490 [bacterium]